MNEIAQHEVRGLREAIALEKKKRVRGKRLKLLGEGDSGQQLFSPAQVARAKALLTEKREAEQQRRDGIKSRKAEVAIAWERKAEEKRARAAVTAANWQLVRDQKVHEKAERVARKAL